MNRNQLLKMILTGALCHALTLPAAITVINPAAANHTPKSDCPALDGSNQLNPDPAQYLAPPPAGQGVLAELANGDSPFPGWTFNAGAALNGTLTINYYHSRFVDTHFSGAQIKATYTPGPGDPSTLRFVQMIETSDPLNGATSPYVDPYPNDDPTNAPLPFYWTEKETKKFGLTFYDFSKRSHPPTSSVTWRGNLYLTSWDGNVPGTVTVHDGVKWGFDAGCIEIELVSLSLTSIPQPNRDINLTWPSNSVGGQIESATNLSPPSLWTLVPATPVLSNGQFHVSVPTPYPQQFFRLSLMPTGALPAVQPAFVRVPPQPDTVEQGHEAYFSVKADGSQPIRYQWSVNGVPIPGATNRDLVFPHVDFTNHGLYTVSATNTAGGETSDPAWLTVIEDTNAPVLISAAGTPARTQITVRFSEGVNPATALDPAHYQVQQMSPPPGTVFITSVSPTGDESIVLLNPASPLPPNSQFLLQVFNITDFATPPNPIAPGSITTFTTGP
jgi:hypothetical protein